MDIYDFINTYRFEWDILCSNIISEIIRHRAILNIQDIPTLIHPARIGLNYTRITGPAVYLSGGAAYVAYDGYNHLTHTGTYNTPIVTATPPTNDWDVSIFITQDLTPVQKDIITKIIRGRIDKYISGFTSLLQPLSMAPSKLELKTEVIKGYTNYYVIVKYQRENHKVFEFMFKREDPPVKEIHLLPIHSGIFAYVPDILSLMELTLYAIGKRAPIEYEIAPKVYVENRNFFKCIQDYYRLQYIIDHIPQFTPGSRPVNRADFMEFVGRFNALIDKYPYCKSTDVFQPGRNKLSGKAIKKLSTKLWKLRPIPEEEDAETEYFTCNQEQNP